jgi:hypothetical protein
MNRPIKAYLRHRTFPSNCGSYQFLELKLPLYFFKSLTVPPRWFNLKKIKYILNLKFGFNFMVLCLQLINLLFRIKQFLIQFFLVKCQSFWYPWEIFLWRCLMTIAKKEPLLSRFKTRKEYIPFYILPILCFLSVMDYC